MAYAVEAVVAAVGGNKIMPSADYPCTVINAQNGYVRENTSWIIGRVMRDFDDWKDTTPRAEGASQAATPVQTRLDEVINSSWEFNKAKAAKKNEPVPEKPPKAGLCVSVYRAREAVKGYPGYDASYFAGLAILVLQLGVSAIPLGIYGDWSTMLISVSGTILAFLTGALPQWKQEKWSCRHNSKKTIILTTGNGSQHAIAILGAGKGLDLEELAAADVTLFKPKMTRWGTMILGTLWIILLITASGIGDRTWYLLAVGSIGIVQNIYAAGTSRTPAAFGMPLEFVEVVAEPKVMATLLTVEAKYKGVGKNILPIFFPGDLRTDETAAWKALE